MGSDRPRLRNPSTIAITTSPLPVQKPALDPASFRGKNSPTRMSDDSPSSRPRILGHSEVPFPDHPDKGKEVLDPSISNPNPDSDLLITLDCSEFTSLCPETGQPDFARIEIEYVPDAVCLETKSLKFYLASFRNFPAFNEQVVTRILDDLVEATRPRLMTVRGIFAQRGGISLTAEARYSQNS